MANLLDTIRNNSVAPEQGVTDEAQKLQTLLRARSGKQLSGTSVAGSNLGEQAAVAQTNQQMQQQVAPQAAIQSAQLAQQSAQIQQQEQQQRGQVAQSRRFDDLQTTLKIDSTLKELERNKGQIDMNKEGARLEQLGAALRLQDKQYVDNLQREGQLARLSDDNAFREAALRSTMGDKMQIINKSIDNNAVFNDNSREFSRKVATIDIDSAYQMFNADMAAQKQQALYSGGGALLKAGIGAYGTFGGGTTSNPTASEMDTAAGGQAAVNNTGTNKYGNVS
jgi:hypothetical protein